MKKSENEELNDDNLVLKSLQRIELEMLKDFIRVCDKLHLKYYLDSGTLLGAIRHKGFIPWDDDIDVSMPRKDYDIFIAKAQKLLDKKYFIQTHDTDKEYFFTFAKIRNSETTFIETAAKDFNINHGVYIDIFPIDNFDVKKKLVNKKDKLKKKLLNAQVNNYFKMEKNNELKAKIARAVSYLLFGKCNKDRLVMLKEKMSSRYRNVNTDYCHFYCFNSTYLVIPKFVFGEGKMVDFEDIKARVPNDYDKYLTMTYGDYMKLPPENERKPHHYNEIIDLENSYKKYMK